MPPSRTRPAVAVARRAIAAQQARPDPGPADLAGRLRLLADPTRLAALAAMAGDPARELNVTALGARLGLGPSATSHHLALLRHAGLVERRRAGKRVFYRVRAAAVAAVAQDLGRLGGGA